MSCQGRAAGTAECKFRDLAKLKNSDCVTIQGAGIACVIVVATIKVDDIQERTA